MQICYLNYLFKYININKYMYNINNIILINMFILRIYKEKTI